MLVKFYELLKKDIYINFNDLIKIYGKKVSKRVSEYLEWFMYRMWVCFKLKALSEVKHDWKKKQLTKIDKAFM